MKRLIASLGAFTLAGISGIQISVFASRSQSWDFYKCGHKNLMLLQIAIHLAIIWELARLFASRRMCERSSKIILVFSIPSFQASVSKQGQCLISGMRSSSVTRIIPLGDQRDISACLNKRKNISAFQSRWKSRSFLCMNAPIMKKKVLLFLLQAPCSIKLRLIMKITQVMIMQRGMQRMTTQIVRNKILFLSNFEWTN